MPKGVEHKELKTSNNTEGSVESLMPKGVEHCRIWGANICSPSVESLMPKGVEHAIKAIHRKDFKKC